MDQENDQIFSSNNSDQYNSPSAIEMRLDTKPLLSQIEKQLRGATSVLVYEADGTPKYETHTFGEPLANDVGIQKIMTFISSIVSSSVVSGNFKEDYFHDYINDFEDTFSKMLIKNRLRWGMKIDDCDSLYNTILFLVIPFISRLINDGERKSMSISTHTQETNTVQGKEGFNLFGGMKR